MLRMIDVIPDKPEWKTNIFDNIVAESWREEARRKEPLLSTKAWGWCLEELRDKAPQFSQTRGVLVYDVGCRISKSSPRLVREVAEKLKAEVDRIVDQDPNRQKKASQLRCIVDPSLCPLVYVHTIVPPPSREMRLDSPWDNIGQGTRSIKTPHLLEKLLVEKVRC